MSARKPTRPRAGLGLSSALGREQITTRDVKVKTTKPASIDSRKPARKRDTDKRAPPR